MLRRLGSRWPLGVGVAVALTALPNCTTPKNQLLVSVKEQKMTLLDDEGAPVATYPISTSKFGLGDQRGSNRTPLGKMEIARKIGDGAPIGAVFKSRRFTGEVIPVDAPGRDPIVTRILWLKGKESQNQNAYGRYIYIHGTPEERNIGRPASFGCIRMRSQDVVDLYERVGVGTEVVITTKGLPKAETPRAPEAAPAEEPPVEMLDPMAPPASLEEAERKPLFASVASRFRRTSPASSEEAAEPETLSTDTPTAPAPAPQAQEPARRRHTSKPVAGPPAPEPTAPRETAAAAGSSEPPASESGSSWHLSKAKAIRLLMSQNHHAPVDSAP